MKTHVLFIFAFLIGAHLLIAQTVTTFTEGTPDDAIALDSNGNIYASNFTGDTVFKFDSVGNATSFITGLNTPNGLAFDSNDNLYVCDYVGQTIFMYDNSGAPLNSFSVSGNPSGLIKSFDSDDVIYTNYPQNTINRLAVDGTISVISSAPELNGPVGLAYDENGVLYVGNYEDREIYRVLANGDLEYIAQLPTDGGQFPNLGFIAYSQGKIWGTIMGSDKIYYVNPIGVDDYTLFAGSTQGGMDGDISEATFNTPNGILFNDTGDTMYVTDFGTKNLRVISDIVLATNDIVLKKNSVQLWPNPSDGILNLTLDIQGASTYSLNIYNLLGQMLFSTDEEAEGSIISKKLTVDFLNSGVYFIKVSVDGNEITKQFIKK